MKTSRFILVVDADGNGSCGDSESGGHGGAGARKGWARRRQDDIGGGRHK